MLCQPSVTTLLGLLRIIVARYTFLRLTHAMPMRDLLLTPAMKSRTYASTAPTQPALLPRPLVCSLEERGKAGSPP